ncbi:expressed unknown protein [Seminavis robusta]|uniref:Glycosyltransferase family 92 protein n=1 Tax=Seminavis robusta TaxID=568900 RepID=A0A9N8HHW3_9STRA|nr:expressed unknown protein [Seminavis robusta]|eukprot:Sro467_g149020.1 n/a (468) ;mRNA; r:63654-65057
MLLPRPPTSSTSTCRTSSSLGNVLISVLLVANLLAFVALCRQQQHELHVKVHTLQERPSHHRALLGDDSSSRTSSSSSLLNVKILVAIAAYDFSQLPHLEEVLDGYHDLCVSGAIVKVVIHTTVAWPVPLLDLLQTRFPCSQFTMDIVLKLPRIRLHLVDCHRKLFYTHLEEYDLFIYTEDDQRVTPRTVATYLQETNKIQQLILHQEEGHKQYQPADFNVGIVRYEYNFPANMVIDDSTRAATENVTRVYWEHSSFKPPIVPNAMDAVPQHPLAGKYVHMKNHHQGMFLATRALLKAWKDRCQFDVASNRPGQKKNPSQPLFGTQRVWMSSQQLYGNKFGCAVQQVLPLDNFGALTVHHLPNKNYRRVGQYRTRDTNRDEGVVVEQEQLLTAMQLHIALLRAQQQQQPKKKKQVRITMDADPDNPPKAPAQPSWKPRIQAFQAYVERGGIMTEQDMQMTLLPPAED